jgi:hypothetical protein
MREDPEAQIRASAENALWCMGQKRAADACGWVVFESPKWHFCTAFPAEPIEKEQPVINGPGTVFILMANRGLLWCQVAITEFPADAPLRMDDEALDAFRDLGVGMFTAQGAKLKEEKSFERGTIKGREITFERTVIHDSGPNTTILKSRYFWVGRRLYGIQVVYNPELSVLPAVDYFLDSFEVREAAPDRPK